MPLLQDITSIQRSGCGSYCVPSTLTNMRPSLHQRSEGAKVVCVSGERPSVSFVEDVEGQATHVFGSPEAFGIHWHQYMAFTIHWLFWQCYYTAVD